MNENKEIQIIKIRAGISNCYIIKNDKKSIMIDSGSKGLNKIENIFRSNNIKYHDIGLIIVTHTHQDHVNLLKDLNKKIGAEILVHKDGEKYLKFGQSPKPKNANIFGKLVLLLNKFGGNDKFKPVVPDTIITNDYYTNKFGFDMTIIHTPGHTNDSLTIIIDNKFAFVGDTLFNIFPNTISPIFIDDPDKLKSSWKRLLDLKCNYYFPGHGDKISWEILKRNFDRL